jgi:hypothetical protein
VADARAGVDVVVAEAGAHQLLHQEGFFVGAARRGDAADRVAAVFRLDALELGGGVAIASSQLTSRQGSVIFSRIIGLSDAVLVRGVAPGEAALDAGMAVVGLAVLVRHHAHDLVAAHLGLEGAADAAIGAGGDDAVLGWPISITTSPQRRGRAGLHAGAAGHAFRLEERLVLARPTRESKPRPAMVSAKVPCTSSQARTQREQTMHLLVEGEIGIGFSSLGASR